MFAKREGTGPVTMDLSLFADLQALANTAFPKRCNTCGRVFHTPEEFVRETESIHGVSGFKSSCDDDGRPVVELFRNCPCGSTLMDAFRDRRDTSEVGMRRRAKFGELMDRLEARGLSRDVARAELLKVLRGEGSELLAQATGFKI